MQIQTNAIFSIFLLTLWVFAQSEETYEEMVPNYNGVPVITKSQSRIVDNEQSKAIEARFDEYNLWFISNIFPLSQEAERLGIQVTQDEIAVQMKAFDAIFPGIPCEESNLRTEIMAMKYSKTIPGSFISKVNIQNAYTQLTSGFSIELIPSFADVQCMLEMRALVENSSVQNEIEKLKKQVYRGFDERQKELSETWPISDLVIHAPANNCLALYNDNDSCLLTVEKFNNYIRYLDIAKSFSIDRARIHAIQQILWVIYITNEARKQQAEENNATTQAKQNWVDWCMVKMKYKNLGPPIRDSSSLLDAFSAYYDVLFSKRSFFFYSIIGSSDSFYIDSISQTLKTDTSKRTDQKNDDNSTPILRTVSAPWSNSCADIISEEFNKFIDTMHIKDVSEIIKMPYGYFIVRFDSIQIRPAKRFEDVQDHLVFLATKRKWKNLDSLLEARAYEIYSTNKRLHQTPDTLTVLSFLTPLNQASDSTASKRFMMNADRKTLTGMAKGFTIVSTQLPFDIHDSLLNLYEANNGKKTTLGPVVSHYGVWNFKVLDIYRGGKRLPFSFSKKRLIDSMLTHELEFITDIQVQKPDSTLDNLALAYSFNPLFFGIGGIGTDDTNIPAKLNPQLNIKTNMNNYNTNLMKQNNLSICAVEMGAWLSKLSILFDDNHQEGLTISSNK